MKSSPIAFPSFVCLLALLCASVVFAAETTNIRVSQVGSKIQWEYDLAGKDGETEGDVGLTVTVGGRLYLTSDLHLEGDVGKVAIGAGKSVRWDVLRDFPKGLSSKIDWELDAGGAQSFAEASTGMRMMLVPGGCFEMGDTVGGGSANERPVHEACVSAFFIGKHEVTQGEWEKVMGNNPSNFRGSADHPVENVSWNDVREFIQKLNQANAKKFRLPTEAEWEYAARSGGKKEKWSGSNEDPGKVGWFDGNSGSSTHAVGQKAPNGLGLFDMTGNVWEWCADVYDGKYYLSSPKSNPQGPSSGSSRVLRGGSWMNRAQGARVSARFGFNPGDRNGNYGFRLVVSANDRSPKQKP